MTTVRVPDLRLWRVFSTAVLWLGVCERHAPRGQSLADASPSGSKSIRDVRRGVSKSQRVSGDLWRHLGSFSDLSPDLMPTSFPRGAGFGLVMEEPIIDCA
jgi:hypothetical protein